MDDNQDKKPTSPRRGPQNRPGKKPPLPQYGRGPLSYIFLAIAIITATIMLGRWQKVDKIGWSEFVNLVDKGDVEKVTVKETEVVGQLTKEYLASQPDKNKQFVVNYYPDVHGQCTCGLITCGPSVVSRIRFRNHETQY